jgi:hypothetical protein
MPFFLYNWYLLFGIAAAFPVMLHLLHRRRPQPVPFSTLRFLQDAIAKTRRSRHLTNLMTLLMRVLILLLLALAFSQPQVRFARFIPDGPRNVILVLDGSVSMHFQDGEESCFDVARKWALELIGSLSEGDMVAVWVPGLPEPRVVFPLISDHDAVRRALSDVAPGFGEAHLVEALSDLLGRLPEGDTVKGTEVHVFSDFQSSAWDDVAMESVVSQLSERDMPLFLNHVQPAVAANAGISKASFYPPAILGDGEFQARVTVRSSPEFSGGNTLRLMVQSEEQNRRSFDLLPDQETRIGLPGQARGSDPYVMGQLELDADGFQYDNTYRFCLPRLPGIPVLLVDGSARGSEGQRDTFFLRHAIQPRGKSTTLFLPKEMDWPTFVAGDLQPFSVIYVCNPPSLGQAAIQKMESFARSGGAVVLMPGQNHALEPGITQIAPLKFLRVRKEVLPQEQSLAIVSSERPSSLEKRLLSLMPAPSGIVVRQRLVIEGIPADGATAFHYAAGGAVAVQVPYGQGSFWVTSVGGNRDWSEWPLTPFFVLFHQELIKSSARRSLTQLTGSVGSPLAFEWSEDATELDFRVRDPGGTERVVHVSRPDAGKPVIIGGFTTPGFFRIIRGDRERVVAVNIPESETSLRYLSTDDLALSARGASVYQARSWHEHQQVLTNLRHGKPLWPFLLFLAFFLTVAEELFANLRSRATVLPEALRQFLRRGARAT